MIHTQLMSKELKEIISEIDEAKKSKALIKEFTKRKYKF